MYTYFIDDHTLIYLIEVDVKAETWWTNISSRHGETAPPNMVSHLLSEPLHFMIFQIGPLPHIDQINVLANHESLDWLLIKCTGNQMDFTIKNMGLSCKLSHHPTLGMNKNLDLLKTPGKKKKKKKTS